MSDNQSLRTEFRKSSFSGSGNCVEVAYRGESVLVRDSKNPQADLLAFTPDEWNAFIQGAKNSEFDLP